MSESHEEFDFKEWIALTRISDAGAKKLEAALINDLETLLLFRESDAESLRLPIGDGLRFRNGLLKLHTVSDIPPKLETDTGFRPIITVDPDHDEKVYSLRDVEKLLAGKQAVAAGNSKEKPVTSDSSTIASSLMSLVGGISF